MRPIKSSNKAEKSRKERRKEERLAKKKSHGHAKTTSKNTQQPLPPKQQQPQSNEMMSSPKPKKSTTNLSSTATDNNNSFKSNKRKLDHLGSNGSNAIHKSTDPYYGLDPSIAAALRRDDEEIAMLESKLLLKSKSSTGGGGGKKSKDQLQREYAKQEGYGTDFIDFLDDLDTLVQNVVVREDDAVRKRKYKTLNINELEERFSDSDDFSDASSEMDDSEHDSDDHTTDDDDSIVYNNDDTNEIIEDDDGVKDDDSEEIIPMKAPANDECDHFINNKNDWDATKNSQNKDDHDDELYRDDDNQNVNDIGDTNDSTKAVQYDDDSEKSDDDDENDKDDEPDHDIMDVYQPSTGEDIYGNIVDTSKDGSIQPKKYVPPHLRKGQITDNDGSKLTTGNTTMGTSGTTPRELQRILNNALNRLSENTIISVVQAISQTYNTSYPTADINASLWDHIQNACIVNQSTMMTGLIPIYIATFVGIYIQKGDTIQFMEYILEKVVTKFWEELQNARTSSNSTDDLEQPSGMVEMQDDEIPVMSSSKEVGNLLLIICYMYNFGVVHCTLLYDIIRHLIENCSEIDVEMLLLLLNHCGRALRSDDPNALKEITALVQQKQASSSKTVSMNTSRAQYMINTLMELKKSKRRKQDQTNADQTQKLRKILGQIKSNATSKGRTGSGTSSDASLRITLQDILDVNTKGRWWKVGASWAGGSTSSQLLHGEHESNIHQDNRNDHDVKCSDRASDTNDVLLQLAAKYRMNTDTRRTIFCIIMSGSDYEDCFEKLVRAGMIKNRCERDTVRVIVECCCNEKSFNPYYAHLSARICDYQPQCKFTFQLAYWDTFKQLDAYKPRKVANLAKLLYHLVAVHQCLKLNVIKAIDIAAPEELSESALIFVTIFLSSIMEHFDKPEDTFRLFKQGNGSKKGTSNTNDIDNDMYERDNNGIHASITIFLVQVLKSSPKYVKGSKFRTNLKAAIKACDTDGFF